MGIVYEAYDPQLDRRVALKVLPPELTYDPRFVARFLREGRLAAALSHPNVVTVYEAGEAGGQYYLAMELVAGTNLSRFLRERGPLDPDPALRILQQVAAALDAAHARGIVHRDVKPGNILLPPGSAVKVSDFGIARTAGEAGPTQTGDILGTAEYMSPEQARGERTDFRTDIYSLGCVAYEMLTGQPPFGSGGDNRPFTALLHDHAYAAPRPARLLNPRIPARAERVLAAALTKDPAQRPGTASGFVQDLIASWEASPALAPRRAVLAAAGAAATLGLVGGLVWNLAQPPRQPAAGSQVAAGSGSSPTAPSPVSPNEPPAQPAVVVTPLPGGSPPAGSAQPGKEKPAPGETYVGPERWPWRHGWVFGPGEVRDYFVSQSWYRPRGPDEEQKRLNRDVEAELNAFEKRNAHWLDHSLQSKSGVDAP
jgi:serine/threonine-protein kinase